MSHESMSQVGKKNFCRNNKIMCYVYLFCIVVLLLPARGTELVVSFNVKKLDLGCLLAVPRPCRVAKNMAA